MSNGEGPNRTVFRPSPLQGARGAADRPEEAPPMQRAAVGALPADDIPAIGPAPRTRSLLLTEAGPILALAARLRAGGAGVELPRLHSRCVQLITDFRSALDKAGQPEELRERATYALAATLDDVVQNMPGDRTQAGEWARRSLVVHFFRENIGGDRFWQLVDHMLARPTAFAELIELCHACLAAGFEGRYRVTADGPRRLHDVMRQLYGALEHVRRVSQHEISPQWRGAPTAQARVGFWSVLALAAGAAAALLLLAFLLFRLVLFETGQPTARALRDLNPTERLRLSRSAPAAPAPPSNQAQSLELFLAPEIAQHLVVVEQDVSTVRVRTTVGQLFKSGSDQLETDKTSLFERIAAALQKERPATITVEGYTDSDRISGLSFADNQALSKARADKVADLLRRSGGLGPITAEGFGDSRAIASNATPDGKSLNRRVEIVIPRTR